MAPATVSAGWLREIRSAIVARVRDHNPMEVADDLAGLLVLAPFREDIIHDNFSDLFDRDSYLAVILCFP